MRAEALKEEREREQKPWKKVHRLIFWGTKRKGLWGPRYLDLATLLQRFGYWLVLWTKRHTCCTVGISREYENKCYIVLLLVHPQKMVVGIVNLNGFGVLESK